MQRCCMTGNPIFFWGEFITFLAPEEICSFWPMPVFSPLAITLLTYTSPAPTLRAWSVRNSTLFLQKSWKQHDSSLPNVTGIHS